MGFFSFFSKEKKETLDKGLSKTKESVFGKIARAVAGKSKVDDEVLDNLEEVLITSDVGVETTLKIIERIEKRAATDKYMNATELNHILRDEIAALLTENNSDDVDDFEAPISNKPYVIMVVGVNGVGKTTTIGKLANFLRKKHAKKPLLVACDVYRPAAIDQLKQIGKQLSIEVYDEGKGNPVEISKNAISYAKEKGYDYVLIDTAGRLHIDEELMDELENIRTEVHPDEILLVIDSMMGQDAINVITGFHDKLPLTGVVLTKLDGDTRGGVALSVRHLTHVPIKFIGVSEKLDGLDSFDPERMAGRILGMGDIVSLVEKATDAIDEKEAEKTAKRMQQGKFDLEDFLSTMKQMKKLGPLENILKLLPGAKKMGLTNVKIDPKQLAHIEAIVLSMTPKERRHPEIIKASRKTRIASGSGTSVQEVNKLLQQFDQMKKMMKQFSNGNMKLPF